MILVNGLETDCISVTDRGFQYGDGLFETIEVSAGRPQFLTQHLLRLSESCVRLKIPQPDLNQLTDEVCQVAKQTDQAVVKIIITRGVGGRGYRQPETIQPTRVISLHPFPDYPRTHAEHGINVRFCTTKLGLNPMLAGIKHLNRLEQIMARAEWDDKMIQEGIMLDVNNRIIEGTMTNLFYVKNNVAYTSALQYAGVAGVLREIVKELLKKHHHLLIEHDFGKQTLYAADEVFVCNSIIGIWPVKRIEKANFAVGKLTRQLQDWLTQLKHNALTDA